MTSNEIRLDLLEQGFLIQETRLSNILFEILVVKKDTDGLNIENRSQAYRTAYYPENDEQLANTLRGMATVINNWITERHANDINYCEHIPVMIGTTKGCTKCMGRFGERMNLDLNFN